MLEADQSVEDGFFAGWANALTPSVGRWARQRFSSLFCIVEDAGRPALEWTTTTPCLLIAGGATWADYEVGCRVRCLSTRSFPYFHDEATLDYQGRTGVAFRVQDSRRHYFAGFHEGRGLTVAAREDGNWSVLNSVEFDVDRNRWYCLEARCAGDAI